METPDELFLKEIADSVLHWKSTALAALQPEAIDPTWAMYPDAFRQIASLLREDSSRDAIEKVLNDVLLGFAHSMLVTLDGGSELADRVRLTIIDQYGNVLSNNLHERLLMSEYLKYN